MIGWMDSLVTSEPINLLQTLIWTLDPRNPEHDTHPRSLSPSAGNCHDLNGEMKTTMSIEKLSP